MSDAAGTTSLKLFAGLETRARGRRTADESDLLEVAPSPLLGGG